MIHKLRWAIKMGQILRWINFKLHWLTMVFDTIIFVLSWWWSIVNGNQVIPTLCFIWQVNTWTKSFNIFLVFRTVNAYILLYFFFHYQINDYFPNGVYLINQVIEAHKSKCIQTQTLNSKGTHTKNLITVICYLNFCII